jgi:membrane associated rhomboid family serine protease
MIIEPRVSTAAFLSLIIISALVGGVTMVLFNPADSNSIFLGSSPVIHGFAGAATLLLLLRYSDFARLELVAVVLVDILVLTPWVRYLGPTMMTWFVGAMATFAYSRFTDGPAVESAV